jgi:hypothetical protein
MEFYTTNCLFSGTPHNVTHLLTVAPTAVAGRGAMSGSAWRELTKVLITGVEAVWVKVAQQCKGHVLAALHVTAPE